MSTEQTPLLAPSSSPAQQPTTSSSPTSNLLKFRLAIGVNTPSSPSSLESASPKPSGLYLQVISTIRKKRLQFHIIDILYYFIIITQLLLGATIASLSSLSSLPSNPLHTSAISILGITNSFTAGVLALLKGQGLPDRLRKDEFQMERVRDWMEEVEARLSVMEEGDGEGPDRGWLEKAGGVEGLVREAWERYGVARDTSEMNRPSSYAHQADGPMQDAEGGDNGGSGNGNGMGVMRTVASGIGKAKGKLVID